MMEIRDWILIASAAIVVTGWFVNGLLNRRHEISKKRMEYRLEALHSFLPVYFSFNKHNDPFKEDPELQKKLETARTNFQLYGKQDEIDIFETMVNALEARDIPKAEKSINELVFLIKRRIRNEIGLKT